MAVFSVDSDSIFGATASVQSTADRIQSDTQAMLAQLTNLQGSWTGAAATGFQGIVDRWRAAQRQVEQSLAEIGAALGTAGRQYADAEQASMSLFR